MLAATDEAGMWTVMALARNKVQMPDLPAPGVQEMGEEAGIVLWNCERGQILSLDTPSERVWCSLVFG